MLNVLSDVVTEQKKEIAENIATQINQYFAAIDGVSTDNLTINVYYGSYDNNELCIN